MCVNTKTDTLQLCPGSAVVVQAFDLDEEEVIASSPYSWNWSSSPGANINGQSTASFNAGQSGWYIVELTFTEEENPCLEVSESYTLTDSVYVSVVDAPDIVLELGEVPAAICPGDTLLIPLATNAQSLTLSGGNGNIIIGDVLVIIAPASNMQLVASSTNAFECSSSTSISISINTVTEPLITSFPQPAVVCPGDSVQLLSNSPFTVQWVGPSGNLAEASTIWVQTPGDYFAISSFYEGCDLVSNTLDVEEYATPFLIADQPVLCPNSSVLLEVQSIEGATLTWLAPFEGSNELSHEVSTPGEYTVLVEACNITTTLVIHVAESQSVLSIAIVDSLPVCEGDSVLIAASLLLNNFVWSGANGQDSIAHVLNSGTVQATAEDDFGCVIESNILPVQLEPVPPAPTLIFEPPCIGDPLLVQAQSAFPVRWYHDPMMAPVAQGNTYTLPALTATLVLYADGESPWCEGQVAMIEIVPKQRPGMPVAHTDAPVCTGNSFVLEVPDAEAGVQYIWTFQGQQAGSGNPASVFAGDMAQEGFYSVHGLLDGCPGDTSEVFVSLIATREVVLPGDTAVCQQPAFTIVTDTLFSAYTWQDGSTLAHFQPTESGTIHVEVTDFNGCKSFAEMQLEWLDCTLTVPNIFSPNNDGRNDFWVPQMLDGSQVRMLVYNRWGRLVFESFHTGHWWDGNHYKTGEPCPEGVYFWIIDYVPIDFIARQQSGNLTLVRHR